MNDRGGENHWNGQVKRQESAADAAFAVPFTYRLRFTEDVFAPENSVLADVMANDSAEPAKALVLVDRGVADTWPNLVPQIHRYFERHSRIARCVADAEVVPGGEQAKNNSAVLERTQELINAHHICRQSYVIAIGGGAVLDAVGYGASTAHRGVRQVRIPTTTLAQGDAGIGVKNGINAFGKKNFLGTFNVPWAVINDARFLATLSDRDWRCGLSEAVKVALVKDGDYFHRIEAAAPQLRHRDTRAIAPVLDRCAHLHLEHIVAGGDPFELTTARPLDFGHWAAHKLEQMTNFELRHGEAVAIGMAIDVVYSALEGLIGADDIARICECLGTLGFELSHQALSRPEELLGGLEEFREHLGGELTIALLAGIGKQVDVHAIDRDRMMVAIERVKSLDTQRVGR